MKIRKPTQAGNILFLILIAVALFAALSYAISQMLRDGGGGNTVSKEKAALYATEILDYTTTIRRTVQDLRISNGCEDTDISFENNVVSGYTNGSNTACQIFHPDGGALNWIDPSENIVSAGTYLFTGATPVTDLPVDTSANAELLVILSNVNIDVCTQINKKLNVNAAGDYAPPEEDNASTKTTKFDGSFANGTHISDTLLDGKRTGCFDESGGTNLHFYQVLIAR